MIRKLLVLAIFFGGFYISFGQKEKVLNLPNFDKPLFHYGFYLGLNNNGFKVSYKPSFVNNPDIEVQSAVGFNVGLISDLRIHHNLNLRFEPGLMSNSKTLIFKHMPTENKNRRTREVGSTFLHLPFILKASTNRINNVRPYVLGGISFNHNFTSNQKNKDDNFAGNFRTKSSITMYEVGIGIDLYLNYFKLSPSIRGIFAINNELKYDNSPNSAWTDPIDFLGTRGVFLHLAFE